VKEGPAYVFRNYIYDDIGSANALKMGKDSYGRIYLYHNTYYSTKDSNGFTQTNSRLENVVSKNNIIHAGRYVFEMYGGIDFDYDSLYSTDPTRFVKWNGHAIGSGLSAFQSFSGQELHAISVADNRFVDPANGDLHLQPDSPAIDVGTILPGFNDENSPWPFNGVAPDMGLYETAATGETDPPYTTGHSPAPSATDVNPNTNIVVHVKDDGSGVYQSKIVMTVEGTPITPAITGSPSDYTLTYDPPADFALGQVIDVTVDAQDGAATPNIMPQDAYSFTITSTQNNPPVIDPIGNKTVAEGELLEFTVNATDADGPSPLAYSASDLPAGASFNTVNRIFSWTPSYTQAGGYTDVHFEVTDGMNSTYENITITVPNVDQPPQADAGSDQEVSVNDQVTLNGSNSSDSDNDVLTYTWTQTSGPAVVLSGNTTATPSFTPTVANTYIFSLVVNDGTVDSDPDSVTIIVKQWPYLPIRVNCGGEDYTDSNANIWRADQFYVAGYWGWFGDDYESDLGTDLSISDTEDDRIYQTLRWGLSGYRFDLGNGEYDIKLHFTETWGSNFAVGARVFDISVEGQLILDNFDIYSEVGPNTALIKTINNVPVTDGQLTIEFTPIVDNHQISGIEILRSGSSSLPPPSGGGSGGGGGGGGGGGAGITSLTEYVTGNGRFLDDVGAKSDDRKVLLYIPEGTVGLNSAGYMLSSITIREQDSYPKLPDYYILLPPVYHITPVGATFEPAIDLTIDYDTSMVPESLAEKNLVIATCETRGDEWTLVSLLF
jgi:hypothetical protein